MTLLEVKTDGRKECNQEKLMDLQIDEEYAHKLADDRKWDDVKILTPGQIAQICGIDSGTAQRISDLMAASSKSARKRMLNLHREDCS